MLDHVIETGALNWLQQTIPSDATLPSRIEADDRWHYLNKSKTCGYLVTKGYSCSGIPWLKVIFNDFKNGGNSKVFNSYETTQEWLSSNRRVHHQSTPRFNAAKKSKWAEQQKARKKQQSVRYDTEQLFPQLGLTPNETQVYLQERGINLEDLGEEVRFGNDANHPFIPKLNKHGDYLAVLVRSMLNEQLLGIQRTYADGSKRYTWGTNKSKIPYTQLGSLENHQPVHFTEGLAKGLLLRQVFQQPVIITLDANNLPKVVKQFHQKFPHRSGYVWADNNQWKYDHADNVGTLKATVAAQLAHYQLVIPQFTDYDCSNQPTDINDLFQLGGAQAIQALYKSAIKPLTGYEWEKQRLNYIGLRQVDKITTFYAAIRRLCLSGVAQTPIQSLETITAEIIQIIANQQPRIPSLPVEQLIDYAKRFIQRKYHQQIQASVRQISPEILKQFAKIVVFDLDKDEQGHEVIPLATAEQIINEEGGLHAVVSPKGTQKTLAIMKPAIAQAKQHNNFPMVITPLIGLSRNISNECGTANYQDIINGNDASNCDSVVATINSINKSRLQPILQWSEELYADEIDAVLDAIATGTVDKAEKPEIYNHLLHLIQTTPKVVLTSADMDNLCLEPLLPLREDTTLYIERSYLPDQPTIKPILAKKRIHLYRNYQNLLTNLTNFITNGGCAGFACDSVNKVHNLAKWAQSKGIKALEISKNTINSPAVRAFLDNPNEEIKKYQLIPYTPSLGIGISIKVSHLERIYGTYHRETTTSNFLQMLFRSRPTLEYHLAFPPRPPKKFLSETQREQWTLINAQKTYQRVGYQAVPTLSPFDVFRIKTLAQREREQDPNNILRRLIAEGAQLIYETTPAPENSLKSEFQALSKQEQAQQVQSIMQLISQWDWDQAKDYLGQPSTSLVKDDNYSAAQLVYYLKTPHEDDVTFWLNSGYQKSLACERSLAPPEEALRLDFSEVQHLPVTLMDHHRTKQVFNYFLLRVLQLIDDESNFVENPPEIILSTDSPIAQFIVKQIWAHREFFNGVSMGVKITAQTLSKPVQFLRNWLGTLGIAIKRLPRASATESRNYVIDHELIKRRLIPILQQRRLDGQSDFKDRLHHHQDHINNLVTDNSSNLSRYNSQDGSTSDNLSELSRHNNSQDSSTSSTKDNLLANNDSAKEWLNHQLTIHPPINQLARSGGRRARRYGGGEEDGA